MKSPLPLTIDVPGWYGKLPSLGDFASRRLPDEFIHTWDEWLELGFAQQQSSHRARGRKLALHRFWVAPHVLSEASWAGVLAPSVDRVGRRFPLTIAASLAPQPSPLAAALAAPAWYAAMEGVARRCVEEKLSVAQFECALAEEAAADSLRAADASDADDLAAELLRSLALPSTDAGSGAADAVACSVWWRGDASERASFLCVPALPVDDAFDGLLAEVPSPTSASARR
jgi:type VI secretion system protein ImpM